MNPKQNSKYKSINTLLLNLMVLVITVAIIFLIPLDNQLVRIAVALIIGILNSFFVGVIMSLNTRLNKIGIHDELTNLYNTNFLSECKYRTISTTDRQQAKLGIMTISIHGLSRILDTFDVKTANAVIRYVGEGITASSRATEYIFRLEDDTFLIFFADINEYNNIKVIKSRLNNYFEKPFIFNSNELLIKLNFGYAVYPDDGTDFDSVMSVAKQRMYIEKSRE